MTDLKGHFQSRVKVYAEILFYGLVPYKSPLPQNNFQRYISSPQATKASLEKDVKSAESAWMSPTPTPTEQDYANLEADVEILSTAGANEDILHDLVSAEKWKQ